MKWHTIRRIAAAAGFAVLLAGCDLSGIESAADDFDLIIELQPIYTTVAAQVLDAETLEPVSGAELTFSGRDAGVLIDIYSDPIRRMTASEGVVTFGLHNVVLPTQSSPVDFVVTAEAEGYLTERVDVVVADSGGNGISLLLVPDRVETTIAGAAGIVDARVTTSEATGVHESVTVTTPLQNDVRATGTATIHQNVKPVRFDGAPLSGTITTELQVFDLEEGLDALPSQLKSDPGEALLGVMAFGMTDEGGRLALDFEVDGPACAVTLSSEMSNEDLYAAIESGEVDEVRVVVSSLDAEENVEIGAVPLQLGDRPDVAATICIGGQDANVDMTAVREAGHAGKLGGAEEHRRGRLFYSFRWIPPASRIQNVVVDNRANAVPQTVNWLRISGLGHSLYRRSGFTVPAGEKRSIPFDVSLPGGRTGYVAAELATGGHVTDSYVVPSGTFSRTLLLPAVEAEEYTVRASLSCPSGQELSPQLTENSFSGLSLGYRPAGERIQFADMGKARTIEVTPSSVHASATATLIPGRTYEFRAVYDSRQEIRQSTAAVGSNELSFDVNPSEISGLRCE